MIDVSIYSSDSSFNGIVEMKGSVAKVNLLRVSKEQVPEHSTSLNMHGIYLLLIGSNCIYVGQTSNTTIDKRIMGKHSGTIDDDWHTVVAFPCINPKLSTDQLEYMENAMCEYVYKNYPHCATTNPAKDVCNAKFRNMHYKLGIGETRECDKCLKDMQEFIRMFPNGIFPPSSPETPAKYITGGGSVPTVVSSIVGVPLFATQGGSNANGYLTNTGYFVVKADSLINPGDPTASCPDATKNRLIIEAANLDGNKLLKDLVFTSSSAAASFVTKSSASGNAVWRTADGTKLGDISVVTDTPTPSPAKSAEDEGDTPVDTPVDADTTESSADEGADEGGDESEIRILYCRSRGSNARGYIRADGKFIVMAGSFVTALDFTGACPTGTKKLYAALQDKLRGNMLLEDIEFNSPSGAACFVMKSSANGNDHWYTEDKIKLGELK